MVLPGVGFVETRSCWIHPGAHQQPWCAGDHWQMDGDEIWARQQPPGGRLCRSSTSYACCFFNLTERENGETRALQPRELYRSQQYGTAIYRAELAMRKELGYVIERKPNGAPEIKGYTEAYIEASS